ncbi:YecA family protein [Bacillus dakarensis]|uniref:YecA family protein n=1 Tax=Robertmurraya dakarensis TaxID=1926278 RepID=UPI0009812CA1|nr:SEC-C metal-binding domain-containing protein [Bacillus dakarensis]
MIATKTNRNDPCPCGSGKIYRVCCGANETVSITSIIEKEVTDLQTLILDYALTKYDDHIQRDFEEAVEELTMINEEETDFLMFVHSIWYILFVPIDGEKTILHKFMEERSKMIKRPGMKDILDSWRNPQAIAGRMISFSPEKMVLKDAFTGELHEIKLLDPMEPLNDAFVFGFVVPFRQEQVFFLAPYDIEGDEKRKEEEYLQAAFSKSSYEDHQEYLNHAFLEIMCDIPFVGLEFSPEDFEWSDPMHKEVAELYHENMQEEDGSPFENIMSGLILWYKFCEVQRIQKEKPEAYAAALHYLIMTLNPLLNLLKKEIASIYGVSAANMSAAIKEIEEVASADLNELRDVAHKGLRELLDEEGGRLIDEVIEGDEDVPNNIVPFNLDIIDAKGDRKK